MTFKIKKDELPSTGMSWKFEGFNFNNTNVSFFIIEFPPLKGAKLHKHPYEEVFINLEGQATFTVGNETIVANKGDIVIAPPNVPHKFINSGEGILKQVDIHPASKMVQFNLEE